MNLERHFATYMRQVSQMEWKDYADRGHIRLVTIFASILTGDFPQRLARSDRFVSKKACLDTNDLAD
jgi:hypothetical protein